MIELGVAYLPEERKRQGFSMQQSVREGITVALLKRFTRFGLINKSAEQSAAASAISTYLIRASSAEQSISSLSGGNQQKALLARWLELDPDIIILDEPTRGVDIGAKAEIHRLIDQAVRRGKAILLISSDLPELIALSDRVVVLHQGAVATELHHSQITQERVLLAASGLSASSV
jgi:ABC-type sugar transport system ATPase subunit